MSITLYSKFRRQNLRRAWHFAGMTEWVLNVATYIAIFISALILVQYVTDIAIADEQEKVSREARKVAKLEETWLSCLNNKGLWINDRLHICSVADTHIRQGE